MIKYWGRLLKSIDARRRTLIFKGNCWFLLLFPVCATTLQHAELTSHAIHRISATGFARTLQLTPCRSAIVRVLAYVSICHQDGPAALNLWGPSKKPRNFAFARSIALVPRANLKAGTFFPHTRNGSKVADPLPRDPDFPQIGLHLAMSSGAMSVRKTHGEMKKKSEVLQF